MLVAKNTRNRDPQWSIHCHGLHTSSRLRTITSDRWTFSMLSRPANKRQRGGKAVSQTITREQLPPSQAPKASPKQNIHHPPTSRTSQPGRISHNPIPYSCLRLPGENCMMGNASTVGPPIRTELQPIRTGLAIMAEITLLKLAPTVPHPCSLLPQANGSPVTSRNKE